MNIDQLDIVAIFDSTIKRTLDDRIATEMCGAQFELSCSDFYVGESGVLLAKIYEDLGWVKITKFIDDKTCKMVVYGRH